MSFWSDPIGSIVSTVENVGSAVVNVVVNDVINPIGSAVAGAVSSVEGFVGNLWDDFVSAGEAAVDSTVALGAGLIDGAGSLGDAVIHQVSDECHIDCGSNYCCACG